MSRGSLRLRLFLAAAISVGIALVLSGLGLTLLFERHVERRVVAELGIYLDQVVAGLDRGVDGRLEMARILADPRFVEPLSGLYWQIETDVATLRSRSLWDAKLALPDDELVDGAVHEHRIPGPLDAELYAVERRVKLPSRLGGEEVRATVALDTADIAAATRAFAVDLAPFLALVAALLMAAAYTQVAVGLKPLVAVRDRLGAIREGRARRLGQAFPDEILPLAGEVDALIEAREDEAESARARAGDLAHGLKTPLQVLAGDVERLRAKGEGGIASEIEQVAIAMRRHVGRELARARTAASRRDARAPIADVVTRVLSVVTRTPVGAKLDWSVDVPAEMVGRIDPDDLAEAIGNLVENASRYAHAKVSITARRKDSFIVITIADDGGGIPEERVGEALARGGQLDRLGGGAGLGLAIVRDIADAWDGTFDVRNGLVGLEADFALRGY